MTRVFGRLFPDGRNGVIAITASKPFLGAERDEEHYDVIDGSIDIELLPTPRGIHYNVAFKRSGDTRRSIYTTRWSVPNSGELDVTPNPEPEHKETVITSQVFDRVHTKRLAADLSSAVTTVDTRDKQLRDLQQREYSLRQELDQFKQTSETLLTESNRQLSALKEQAPQAEVKTIIKKVPVPPAPLEDRIKRLEEENSRLHNLNDQYYQAFVELHQLKLERAQSVELPDPVIEVPGTPQQRLIQKLLAK